MRMRLKSLFFLSLLACGRLFANIGVELDVVFKTDSDSVQYKLLYVLAGDTLAVFDSLHISGKERTSLFYFASADEKNVIVIVDAEGKSIQSKPFKLSPRRTTFSVAVRQQSVDVVAKDFLYLRKYEEERSYYVFLMIFFVTKFLLAVIFIFAAKIPKRNISTACGAFLLSAFIDWFLPLEHILRFLLVILSEYLLVALFGRRSISWLQTALLVIVVNMVGFGIIATLYLAYVFW